ncbi:hypothetical protein [Endozoicomonas sp. Mp262]|uniref:hypothetical protein n=1 Tax=Endozoicomonas sp. Mp262 TaxID=2919499 RepID=UPI0021DB2995
MSSIETEGDEFVRRAEFDALAEKVEEGFLDIRRHQCRTDTHMLEIRRELSHHSDLLSELQSDVRELKSDVRELKRGQVEHGNMLKQILELVSKP